MKKPNNPTKSQREVWSKLAEHGCVICGNHAQIHHAGTGGGGRKNHDFVIPLCFNHHQGVNGLHTIGRKAWQQLHGTEAELHREAMAKII